jgi:hypothetical protein
MNHTCENCNHTFKIRRHRRLLMSSVLAEGGNQNWLQFGTGKNMVYKGDMNREYAMCPSCGVVEHQFSAEARDQGEGADDEQDGGNPSTTPGEPGSVPD